MIQLSILIALAQMTFNFVQKFNPIRNNDCLNRKTKNGKKYVLLKKNCCWLKNIKNELKNKRKPIPTEPKQTFK